CECTTVFTRVRAPHRRLTSGGVSQIVRAASVRAGLPVVHAHRLRHTAATQMLQTGASLPEVGQVLRHASMLSTAIYAKVDRDRLRSLALPWPGRVS
ncbi:MAG: tyrosine-type recombinase/integrase, partial [Acidimicrobiales bacterium]